VKMIVSLAFSSSKCAVAILDEQMVLLVWFYEILNGIKDFCLRQFNVHKTVQKKGN
jgi:hypothetical protein